MDYILQMHSFDAHRSAVESILAVLFALETWQDQVKRATIHLFEDDEETLFEAVDGIRSHDEVAVDGVVEDELIT